VGVIIKDIERNSNEIIRVEVSEFKGRELINLRIWYQSMSDGEMTYKPTQKGVALNIEKYEELKEAIDKIGEYIHDRETNATPEDV